MYAFAIFFGACTMLSSCDLGLVWISLF